MSTKKPVMCASGTKYRLAFWEAKKRGKRPVKSGRKW